MDTAAISERARRVLAEIPPGVAVVAAAKTRTPDEIRAVLSAGITIVGENYVQEAAAAQAAVGRAAAQWHLIGHLQRNKAKDAVRLFDLIQTVDSERLAEAVDAASRAVGRVTPDPRRGEQRPGAAEVGRPARGRRRISSARSIVSRLCALSV